LLQKYILLKVVEDILLLIVAKIYFVESYWRYFLLIVAKIYFIESYWNYFLLIVAK